MKKLLVLTTAIFPGFLMTNTLISCKISNNSNGDDVINNNDLLIENNITNSWQARTFLASYLNVNKSDFSLDWITPDVLRFRPIIGTKLEKTQSIIDLNIKNDYNGFNSTPIADLNSLPTLNFRDTINKMIIPYNEDAEANAKTDDQKSDVKDGYFLALEYMLGMHFDLNQIDYQWNSGSPANDDSTQDTLTITSKKNSSNIATFNIEENVISYSKLRDTTNLGGDIYLPQSVVDTLISNGVNAFSLSTPYYGAIFQAYVNQYANIEINDISNFYTNDIANYFKNLGIKAFIFGDPSKIYNLSVDEKEHQISYQAKYLAEDDNSVKSGIVAPNDDEYFADFSFSYTTEYPENYDYFTTYLVDNLKFNNGFSFDIKPEIIDKISDLTKDKIFTSDKKISTRFANMFGLNSLTLDKNISDDEIKTKFIENLNSMTASQLDANSDYLYNEVELYKYDDHVVVAFKVGSRMFNNNSNAALKQSEYSLIPETDENAGSYCFSINYNN